MITLQCPDCQCRIKADIDMDPGQEFWCHGMRSTLHRPIRLTGADRVRRRQADGGPYYHPTCGFCQEQQAAGVTFFPSHFAMDGCQSGQRNHCTCDLCF